MHTKTTIKPSDKILNIPKYIFAELDEWKQEARERGLDLIDLGIGNPDRPTPDPIVQAAIESIKCASSHGYPCFRGKKEFRDEIKRWMKSRYNIELDESMSVQTLSGAKEGLANVALAFTNPGDINIVPDPYYPVMSRGTWIAGGEVYNVPLKEENNFLPDLDSIPEDIAQKAKIFMINYPNNPTGAVATKEFLEKLVKFCKKYNILLVYDLAYGEICFDGYRPLSIFEIEEAKEIAVEFHSFSKTFNMAGWRIGFVIGKKEFIEAIYAMKTNMDYGTATIVQDAAIKALQMDYKEIKPTIDAYSRRRDLLVEGFKSLGWDVKKPIATMYFWLKVPNGLGSKKFCRKILDETGVVFTPGIAFGSHSDGYFRISTVQPDEKIIEAFDRLKKYGLKYE